jgi:hypothetical protein
MYRDKPASVSTAVTNEFIAHIFRCKFMFAIKDEQQDQGRQHEYAYAESI